MSLFPLTNSEIPFFWYGFKHKFVNLEHSAKSSIKITRLCHIVLSVLRAFRVKSSLWLALWSGSTFQNFESSMWLAEHGKGMLFSVEQVFVGREAIRAPLKMPVGEGTTYGNHSRGFQWGGGERGLENECWRCEFLGLFEVILPQKIMKSRGSEVSIYPALRTQARFFLYKLSMCWKKAQAGKNVKNR